MMNAYFVALPMPDYILPELTSLVGDLAGVRWLSTEQYHITLAYLGPIGDDFLDDLVPALAQVKHRPMTLALESVLLYPESGEPRAIVTNLAGNESLDSLRRKINRAALEAGLEQKRKRFKPHVTIGRFAVHGRLMSRPDQLGDFLAARAPYASEPFEVYSFRLYSSCRTGEGVEYETVREYELI